MPHGATVAPNPSVAYTQPNYLAYYSPVHQQPHLGLPQGFPGPQGYQMSSSNPSMYQPSQGNSGMYGGAYAAYAYGNPQHPQYPQHHMAGVPIPLAQVHQGNMQPIQQLPDHLPMQQLQASVPGYSSSQPQYRPSYLASSLPSLSTLFTTSDPMRGNQQPQLMNLSPQAHPQSRMASDHTATDSLAALASAANAALAENSDPTFGIDGELMDVVGGEMDEESAELMASVAQQSYGGDVADAEKDANALTSQLRYSVTQFLY